MSDALRNALAEIGDWDHRGDSVSEAWDDRKGKGAWKKLLALAALPEQRPQVQTSLADQVRDARAAVGSWTPERRANAQLEGGAEQRPQAPELLRGFTGSTEDALRMALRMLHDDQADYIKRNNLGALDNHAMRLAREALALSGGAVKQGAPASLTDSEIAALALQHGLDLDDDTLCLRGGWREPMLAFARALASIPNTEAGDRMSNTSVHPAEATNKGKAP